MRLGLLLLAVALSTAPAAADSPRAMDRYTRGKAAGAPLACIQPDHSVPPRIIDGTAILYWRGRTTYVATFEGGCPQLQEGRIAVTSPLAGSLCRHDAVRILEPTGGGDGFCTFDHFTPYTKR